MDPGPVKPRAGLMLFMSGPADAELRARFSLMNVPEPLERNSVIAPRLSTASEVLAAVPVGVQHGDVRAGKSRGQGYWGSQGAAGGVAVKRHDSVRSADNQSGILGALQPRSKGEVRSGQSREQNRGG